MRAVRAMSIQARIWAIVALIALGMATVILVGALTVRERMMTERENATRQVVEVGVQIVDSYVAQAASGELTLEQAQSFAAAKLRDLRYSGEEYFWINDEAPVMVMHPIKPELEGTDVSGTLDTNGTAIFVEFVALVQEQGAGFVSYTWPKPGSEESAPKVSYVAGVPEWGWVVGSGIYVDDVEAAARTEAARLAAWGLAILVVVAGIAWLVGRSIVRGVDTATAVLDSGDLATRLPEGRGLTELERLAVALNGTLDRAAEVASGVRAAVGDLDSAATQLATGSVDMTKDALGTTSRVGEVSSAAQEVSTGIDTIASATSQMGASIREIAENAQQVARM
ncbi:MAG: cache domain-containing protein, partial [Actinomycetes bacterium]